MRKIAIIGAGVSGLAAAHELAGEGFRVVVFEKSRGVSGRAASRRRGVVRFDHGANFFRTSDPEIHRLIHETLPSGDLVEIPGEVWTFDRRGVIAEGDPKQNAAAKYSYRDGISTLGKLLAAASGAEIRLQQRVARLARIGPRWQLEDSSGKSLGQFDDVITTAPAPQAAEILSASGFDSELQDALVAALHAAPYHQQFSFILGYHEALPLAKRFHALVNSDRGHPVAWLSFEEDKADHVPDGQSVLIVQMAPGWSSCRLEQPREEILGEVLEEVGGLLPEIKRTPDWWDSQRWMLAHPKCAADTVTLRQGEEANLFFAGDGLAGQGRVPLAIKSGLETAQRLIARSRGSVGGALRA